MDIRLDNILIKFGVLREGDGNQIIDITLTDFGLLPVHISKVQDNEAYMAICKNLKCDPKEPELVDMKLLEQVKALIKIE